MSLEHLNLFRLDAQAILNTRNDSTFNNQQLHNTTNFEGIIDFIITMAFLFSLVAGFLSTFSDSANIFPHTFHGYLSLNIAILWIYGSQYLAPFTQEKPLLYPIWAVSAVLWFVTFRLAIFNYMTSSQIRSKVFINDITALVVACGVPSIYAVLFTGFIVQQRWYEMGIMIPYGFTSAWLGIDVALRWPRGHALGKDFTKFGEEQLAVTKFDEEEPGVEKYNNDTNRLTRRLRKYINLA